MKKIILADDHKVIRDGLKMLLESTHEYQVVFEAGNGQEVIDAINGGIIPDLIISDINMPNMDGITMVTNIKLNHPEIPVLIISMLEDDTHLHSVIKAGANAFLTKSVDAEELFFGIKKVLAGEKYVCSSLAVKIIEKVIAREVSEPALLNGTEFSSREIEILQLIGKGLTNAEMADKLFISRRTVEGHRQNLIDKTGARNTAVLMRFAYTKGLID
ncbi:response regulator transcription factor [Pedobacter mucosus]|uniref:response regulator transcription factor n=1 Tax=Pedobacter mucosus TaxID=2895286 RepID=UPI001EE3E177|nr:response regulator transcription factor [Pedobacter mucosus]UKT64772.1 response regulator transcription factor [Pedobacter mucosus]